MTDDRPVAADRVPTLTEVVELLGLDPGDAAPASREGEAVPPADDTPPAETPAATGSPAEVPASPAEALPPEPLPAADATPTPAPAAAAPLDADALVARVMAELGPRIDLMLEARLREALAPALARAADLLIRETRGPLDETLKQLVHEAVTRALQRMGGG